jgi:hypothetical protein
MKKVTVTHEDVLSSWKLRRQCDPDIASLEVPDTTSTPIRDQELREFQATLELLSDGGMGYIPETNIMVGFGYTLKTGTA